MPPAAAAVVARHGTPRDDYTSQVLDALRRVARPASERAAAPQARWAPPPLVTDRPSIAVLPLTSLSEDPAHAALAGGITEDVVNLLARTPELFVIAHSTSRAFAGTASNHREVREQLGVRWLLEGTLRASGTRLRLAVHLTDTFSGTTVWGDHFDRTDADPFAVQDDLAAAILAQIEPQLRLADMSTSGRGDNPAAWRLWQEGWYRLFTDAPQPVPERSLALFRDALELDPDYALAHAGMVVGLGTGVLWGGLPNRVLGEAQAHADIAWRALPDSSAVHYAMAMAHFAKAANPTAVLDHVDRATALEPGNPMYHGIRGYLLANLGRADEGCAACEHAVRLSPRDARGPFLSYMLGSACVARGDYARGLEVLGLCRQFGDSAVDFVWLITAFAQFQLGARDDAVASLQRIPSPRPAAFYHWAVREHLWSGLPQADREAFLDLLPTVGIS